MCTYIYIYIYMRKREIHTHTYMYTHTYIYIYIYIHISGGTNITYITIISSGSPVLGGPRFISTKAMVIGSSITIAASYVTSTHMLLLLLTLLLLLLLVVEVLLLVVLVVKPISYFNDSHVPELAVDGLAVWDAGLDGVALLQVNLSTIIIMIMFMLIIDISSIIINTYYQ